jgi:hypothetical protein
MRLTETLLHLVLPANSMIRRTDEDKKHDSAGQQHSDGSVSSTTLAVLTYQRTSHFRSKPSIFQWPPPMYIGMVQRTP